MHQNRFCFWLGLHLRPRWGMTVFRYDHLATPLASNILIVCYTVGLSQCDSVLVVYYNKVLYIMLLICFIFGLFLNE